MPNWVDVLNEISGCPTPPGPVDIVRRKYLQLYHKKTERNIIAYYSGWLHVGNYAGTEVNDLDVEALMTSIHKLDCSKGLDLILHTPGGAIAAAENMVYYLRSKFGHNIRAIIPQIAMSAGTMIACACKTIVMGNQSAIGPVDPQVNGVPAKGVGEEFAEAIRQVTENPASVEIWKTIISKYHPTFIASCEKARKRSLKMVKTWLHTNMLRDVEFAKVSEIVDELADKGHENGHDIHISKEDAINLGLKIEPLENDQESQDLILTIHHSFMHTLDRSRLCKAIENHEGVGSFYRMNSSKE